MTMKTEHIHKLPLATACAQVIRTFGQSPARRFAFVLPDRAGRGATLYTFNHDNAKG